MDKRKLIDLVSVGPATLEDFKQLGITTVTQLKKHSAHELYEKLCRVTGKRQDPCVEDVFAAAIAQVNDLDLSAAKCNWWYWSSVRKAKTKL